MTDVKRPSKTRGKAFWAGVLLLVAPPLAVALGNRKISEPSVERQATWRRMTRENLLEVIDDEWERAKSLDEKLTKSTAALSISSALGGAAARPLLDGLAASPQKIVVVILLLVAIVSLFSGVIMGFAGLRPKQRGGIGPDFAASTRPNVAGAKDACIEALALFEVSNLRRSNEASGANAAIRNGILAFVLATLLGLFAPRAPLQTAPPPSPISISVYVSNTVQSTTTSATPASSQPAAAPP